MSLNEVNEVQYTFYTQPYLFYPRRIHSYLTAKPLPSNVKTVFEIITFNQETGQMNDPPGKPAGSIPMMRLGPLADNTFIRQSIAILAYLEEVHPRRGAAYAAEDMRGNHALERARVSDIIALTEDASNALGFWVLNSSALYAATGMPQNKEAAGVAEMRLHKILESIEKYYEQAAVKDQWIAGTEGMTLADVALGSLIEYARDMYGQDLVGAAGKKYKVLNKWLEKWEDTEAGKSGGEKMPPKEWSELASTWKW